MDDASKKRSGAQDATAPIWYFDLLSPFAYLALGAVEGLARRREIVLRPVVLGAVLAHWGQLGPAEIPPKRLHTYRLCQFLADQARVPLRFPPRHPFRSLEALRLLAALDCPAGAVRAAFDFTWAEGRDPSDPAEFAALGARLGVSDPAALISQRDARSRLRAWTEHAIAAGVFGVPTLAVDGALFWGLDAMAMAEAALDDPGLLARGEMGRLRDLPAGVARAPG